MLDKPPRIIDPFSPVESIATSAGSRESPSIDVTVPSPTLNTPLSSHGVNDVQHAHPPYHSTSRASDEQNRARPNALGDIPRPFTSDAIETRNSFGAMYPPQLNEIPTRPSPNPMNPRFADYGERYSPESAARYGDHSSPNLRTYSASPQMSDRGFPDDYNQVKGSTTKKSRLNLLNPMSLLARRRSSQNQNDSGNLTINTLHVPALPDNFEPSIRGTITHDFSAPRTRRNPSYSDISAPDLVRREGFQPSPGLRPEPLMPNQKSVPVHSPMFREHFQDDRQALRPEQTGYLHSAAMQNANSSIHQVTTVPAFAKRLPVRLPEQEEEDREDDRPLPDLPEHTSTTPTPPQPTEPPPPPPPPPKRTPSPTLNMPHASVLPKHMTSTSSRFSFQLGGQASSAQERLLEERHKQAQAGRRVSNLSRHTDVDEGNYDDYDFEAEDPYEENIPSFGADFGAEDDGFNNDDAPIYDRSKIENLTSLQRQSLQGFHFTPQSSTFTPTSLTHGSQPTPRDPEGFAIGIADSRTSPLYPQDQVLQKLPPQNDMSQMSFMDGLGITTSMKQNASILEQQEAFDDADLYFDDGEFAVDLETTAEEAFDEDALDDETVLRDIPAENLRRYEAAKQSASSDEQVQVVKQGISGDQFDGLRSSVDKLSLKTKGPSRPANTITGLTEDNLAAYHDALVTAANEAAANGRFDRNVSFAQDSEDEASQSLNGVISDESRLSHNFRRSSIAEDDGFPFDDDMDDDLMIAEANAEALEYDDEGVYGQEFGFYAHVRGKDNAEMVHGGFFGPRGSNGVKRSHSGRANFQEPSLTPITERSEWSTRNSVASLQIPPGIPGSAHSLPSPGIAQLLELDSPAHDEDMTPQALMKLRRGVFGGSQSSISSLGQQHAGSSPLAHLSPHTFNPNDHGSSRLASSIHSLTTANVGIPESEEEDYDDEPTLTRTTPSKPVMSPERPVTPSEQAIVSPDFGAVIDERFAINDARKGLGERRRSSHSRNSSGAESVSYARDTDGRWVLERRRTGEDGGTEVEREWLGNARI